MSLTVHAQDPFGLSVGSASGQPGQTVQVPVSVFGNDDARGIQFDIVVSDVDAFSDIDDSQCGSERPGGIGGFCSYNEANGWFRYAHDAIAFPGGPQFPTIDPIGFLVFTIDSNATVGDVIDLTFDGIVIENAPPTELTVGTITIIDTDAELTLTPNSFDFGTQDINDGAQTADFTIGNDGDNDSLTVSDVTVNGAPFSVSGNCDGETLAPGETCVVTVTFDPAAAGSFSDTLVVDSDAGTAFSNLTGAATATANIAINPPFGPVNLGFGAAGDVLTANGTVSNTGSAAADVSCALTGDVDVFSTDPSPLAATINPGATVDFSLSCALPADAEEGDAFSATLSCDIDGEPAGTHELSCSVSTFEPLPVPTMQAWALGLFALLMLLVGGISIRFFRAA
ncbi:MAG: choice-of-anchor D domain-containing protein [Wenzhouxiangella sp.]